jgi:hypothetical protein
MAGHPRLPDRDTKIGRKLKNKAAIEVDWADRDASGGWVRARVGVDTGFIRLAKITGGAAHAGKAMDRRILEAAVVAITGAALDIPGGVRNAQELLELVKAYDDPDFNAMYIARGGPARAAELDEVHGFRDPRDNQIILRTGRQDMDNLVHELLHQHSHAALTEEGGVIASEGTTEYFRMLVLTKPGLAPPKDPGPGYQQYLDVMTLAAGHSTDVLSAAYFEGNLGPLKASIDGKAEAAYQEFKDAYTNPDGDTWAEVGHSWQKKMLDLKFATASEAWLWLIKNGKKLDGKYIGLSLLEDAKKALDEAGTLGDYKKRKAEARAAGPAAVVAVRIVQPVHAVSTVPPLPQVQALIGVQEEAASSVQRHETAPDEEEEPSLA